MVARTISAAVVYLASGTLSVKALSDECHDGAGFLGTLRTIEKARGVATETLRPLTREQSHGRAACRARSAHLAR